MANDKKAKEEELQLRHERKAAKIDRKLNTKEVLDAQKKVTISIPSDGGDTFPVHAGVNGITFSIPRNKDVEVPESVYLLLKEAGYLNGTQKLQHTGAVRASKGLENLGGK